MAGRVAERRPHNRYGGRLRPWFAACHGNFGTLCNGNVGLFCCFRSQDFSSTICLCAGTSRRVHDCTLHQRLDPQPVSTLMWRPLGVDRARSPLKLRGGVPAALSVVATLVLAACSSTTTVAVENNDQEAYLLRVVGGGKTATWAVPPNSIGLGPHYLSETRPFVLILTQSCEELGRFAPFDGNHTVIIAKNRLVAPDIRDGIANSLTPLTEVPDPCPP